MRSAVSGGSCGTEQLHVVLDVGRGAGPDRASEVEPLPAVRRGVARGVDRGATALGLADGDPLVGQPQPPFLVSGERTAGLDHVDDAVGLGLAVEVGHEAGRAQADVVARHDGVALLHPGPQVGPVALLEHRADLGGGAGVAEPRDAVGPRHHRPPAPRGLPVGDEDGAGAPGATLVGVLGRVGELEGAAGAARDPQVAAQRRRAEHGARSWEIGRGGRRGRRWRRGRRGSCGGHRADGGGDGGARRPAGRRPGRASLGGAGRGASGSSRGGHLVNDPWVGALPRDARACVVAARESGAMSTVVLAARLLLAAFLLVAGVGTW